MAFATGQVRGGQHRGQGLSGKIRRRPSDSGPADQHFHRGGGVGLESAANQIARNSGTSTLSTIGRLSGGSKQETPPANAPPVQGQAPEAAAAAISTAGTLGSSPGAGIGGAAGAPLPGVRITADVSNNSIVVYAPRSLRRRPAPAIVDSCQNSVCTVELLRLVSLRHQDLGQGRFRRSEFGQTVRLATARIASADLHRRSENTVGLARLGCGSH